MRFAPVKIGANRTDVETVRAGGASGGKRIEVVTGVKGVIADSDSVAADFGDSLKGSADSLKAGFGANVACTDPRK